MYTIIGLEVGTGGRDCTGVSVIGIKEGDVVGLELFGGDRVLVGTMVGFREGGRVVGFEDFGACDGVREGKLE